MSLLKLKNVSAKYPASQKEVLKNVSFCLEEGDFAVLTGPSGSGKSSLLSLIKGHIGPIQQTNGEIFWNQNPISDVSRAARSFEIGYVYQNPHHSIVCDTVWHELAFVLENMGLPTEEIRRRTAEIASFFELESLLNRPVKELSGGQLQLLNLASVCIAYPKLLLLDEPTAQLDPASARKVLDMIIRLNKELGITILLSEHRLENLLHSCSHMGALYNGELCIFDTAEQALPKISAHPLFSAFLPACCAVPSFTPSTDMLTARKNLLSAAHVRFFCEQEEKNTGDTVLEAKELWFSYAANRPPVCNDISLGIHKGEILSLVGQNGSGKSTLIHLLGKSEKPKGGKVIAKEPIGVLPQQVELMFSKDSVWEELHSVSKEDTAIENLLQKFNLSELKDHHPYDLSGGESQRLGLCLLLLSGASVLLLDEPAKGLDSVSKKQMSDTLKSLSRDGYSILLVTHDLDFAAMTADTMMQLSGGEITSPVSPREFLTSNRFYTTQAAMICRGICEAVTKEEVCSLVIE